MNVALLERRFGRIGARVKVGETAARVGPRVDVGRDDEGEYFDIRVAPGERVEYVVADVRRDERHLLLMERRANGRRKFLCGRDESRWFVNTVPAAHAEGPRATPQTTRAAGGGSRIGRRLARIKSRLRCRRLTYVGR